MEIDPAVVKYSLNHKFAPPSLHAKKYFSSIDIADLPAKNDISSYGPRIWDQGDLGSCTAHGTIRCYLYALNKKTDSLQHPRTYSSRPSRAFCYTMTRILEGEPVDKDTGGTVEGALNAIAKYSLPDEKYWEYVEDNFFVEPSVEVKQKAVRFHRFKVRHIEQQEHEIKKAIFNNHPVAIGLKIYSSFLSKNAMASGTIPIPNGSEQLQGGHCVSIVGYDDQSRMFLFANSWGLGVGLPEKKGYFNIPYDYILNPNLASDLWICQDVAF